MKRKLPKASTSMSNIIGTELKDVAVSFNKLSCDSTEKSSHRRGGGKTASEEGVDFAGKATKGVVKEKGSSGGWAGEMGKQGKGGWDGEKDGWGRGKGRGGWKGGKVQKKKTNLLDGFNDDTSPDFVPHKKRTYTKSYNKVTQASSVYTQPDQKVRGTRQKLIIKTYEFDLYVKKHIQRLRNLFKCLRIKSDHKMLNKVCKCTKWI